MSNVRYEIPDSFFNGWTNAESVGHLVCSEGVIEFRHQGDGSGGVIVVKEDTDAWAMCRGLGFAEVSND